MPRHDGREPDQLRPLTITPHWLKHAPGSVLIEMGETRVLCAVSVEERVPPHLKDTGEGWVTGEYAMLPASGRDRTPREVVKGRPSGRTMEIQRLIGRALRSVVDRKALGPRTLWVDCDVLSADGGTRTASITGAYVACAFALGKLHEAKRFVVVSTQGKGDEAALRAAVASAGVPFRVICLPGCNANKCDTCR